MLLATHAYDLGRKASWLSTCDQEEDIADVFDEYGFVVRNVLIDFNLRIAVVVLGANARWASQKVPRGSSPKIRKYLRKVFYFSTLVSDYSFK